MAVQDDHMIRNIQDVGRLIAKLLLHEQQPNYKLPEKEADYTEADRLFATIMKLAEEGKINGRVRNGASGTDSETRSDRASCPTEW